MSRSPPRDHGEAEKDAVGLVTTSPASSPPSSDRQLADGDPEKQERHADGASLDSLGLSREELDKTAALGASPGDESDLDRDDATDEGAYAPGDGSDDEGDATRPSSRIADVLDRVVSRVSTKSSWNPGPPPDGGMKAWTAGELRLVSFTSGLETGFGDVPSVRSAFCG